MNEHIQAMARIRNLAPGERTLVYGHIHVSMKIYTKKSGPRIGHQFRQYLIRDEYGNQVEYVNVASTITGARYLHECPDPDVVRRKVWEWKKQTLCRVKG